MFEVQKFMVIVVDSHIVDIICLPPSMVLVLQQKSDFRILVIFMRDLRGSYAEFEKTFKIPYSSPSAATSSIMRTCHR